MGNASHVARRAARGVDRDFPAHPTLPSHGTYNGLVFVAPRIMPADLRPLRNNVRGLWRGPIAASPATPEILFVAFTRATPVDGEAWPGALPLVAADGLVWRSFVADNEPRLPGAVRPSAAPRWIELWWEGARQRVAVDSLESLSIADMWDLPKVTIYPPAPPSRSDGTSPRGGGSTAPRGSEATGADRSTVSIAPMPIRFESGDALSDMTDALGNRSGGALARLLRALTGRFREAAVPGNRSGGHPMRAP